MLRDDAVQIVAFLSGGAVADKQDLRGLTISVFPRTPTIWCGPVGRGVREDSVSDADSED